MGCFTLFCSGLLGGAGPGLSESGICPIFSLVCSIMSFVTNVVILGIFVSRFITPESDIAISRVAVVKTRDSAVSLQLRIVSPYGHYLTDIRLNANFYHHTKTAEGEDYIAIKSVYFEGVPYASSPTNITHTVTDSSPLYGLDFKNLPGWINVMIVAYDEQLQTRVTKAQLFTVEDIRVGYDFGSCFVVPLQEAIVHGGRGVIDMTRFDDVTALGSVQTMFLSRLLHHAEDDLYKKKKAIVHSLTTGLPSTKVAAAPHAECPVADVASPERNANIINGRDKGEKKKRWKSLFN